MKVSTPLLLVVAAQIAAISASGCKDDPVAAPAPTTAATADPPADPAAAAVDAANATDVGPTVATEPLPAPPEAKVEDPGTAPSENDVWVEGYWWWNTPQRAYAWSPGFWQDRFAQPTSAPPEIIYESPGRAPSDEYLYVPGYWMWRGTSYVWFHGYWGFHRDGWAYMHPYWEAHGATWSCSAWGWERYHAGFETEHAGWEFHGGVWERPADFQGRVALARGHAADYRVQPGAWHGHVRGRADVDVHGRAVVPPGAKATGTVYPGDRVTEPAHAGGGHPGSTGKPGEAHPGEAHPAEAHPTEAHPTEAHPTEAHPAEAHPSRGASGGPDHGQRAPRGARQGRGPQGAPGRRASHHAAEHRAAPRHPPGRGPQRAASGPQGRAGQAPRAPQEGQVARARRHEAASVRRLGSPQVPWARNLVSEAASVSTVAFFPHLSPSRSLPKGLPSGWTMKNEGMNFTT